MVWIDTLRHKKLELSLLSSWASLSNFGTIRDFIRSAEYELDREIKRLEEQYKSDNYIDPNSNSYDGDGDRYLEYR